MKAQRLRRVSGRDIGGIDAMRFVALRLPSLSRTEVCAKMSTPFPISARFHHVHSIFKEEDVINSQTVLVLVAALSGSLATTQVHARTAVFGETLAQASSSYRTVTNELPRDCDPVNGGWVCASFNDPRAGDVNSTADRFTRINDRGVVASGATLSDAKRRYRQATSLPRRDCDPDRGRWYCASYSNPSAADFAGTSTPATSSTANGARLKFQAEAGFNFSGSGWRVESALRGAEGGRYIVWRGAEDFRADANNPPAGIKAYDFEVTETGVYEFTARTQARVGNGNAAGDKDNDGWVRFTSGTTVSGVRGDATKWTKFFTSGEDESWKQYSNGEQYDPEFFTPIRRTLRPGTHRVLVGGRSTRFAIDTVGLRKLN